jgi:hypothetical protein
MVTTCRALLHHFLVTGPCRHPEAGNCLANLSAGPTTVLTTAVTTSPLVSKAMQRKIHTSESCTSLESVTAWALRMDLAKDVLTSRRPSKRVVL